MTYICSDSKPMETKYVLKTKDTVRELRDDDLKNWDQINCVYSRKDYDGIVRSFSSKFEFVNGAYELLQSLFLLQGVNAQATIEVYTLNENWGWDMRFESPLDFSTIPWDGTVLTLTAIDNSLSALINARKGTVYEFSVGEELTPDDTLAFDRVPMQESLAYEFTQGQPYDEGAGLDVTIKNGDNPFIGNVGSEISINQAIAWNDDQTKDSNSYLFKAIKDIDVTLDYEITWRADFGTLGTYIGVQVRRNGIDVSNAVTNPKGGDTNELAFPGHDGGNELTDSSTVEELQQKHPIPTWGSWAVIEDRVWIVSNNGLKNVWKDSGKTREEYFTKQREGIRLLKLQAGDEVYIYAQFSHTTQQKVLLRIVSSRFNFNWVVRGTPVDIPVFTPEKIATALLRRIADANVIEANISNYDNRLGMTRLLAAECARGLDNAKLYSSFADFCDWMSTVFGYVYRIGETKPARFKYKQECGQYEGSPWSYLDDFYRGVVTTDNIVYIPAHGKFLYHEPNSGVLYLYWDGWEDYNRADNGNVRLDTLFIIKELSTETLYYFEESDGAMFPKVYEFSDEDLGKEIQTVYFVHRSELFRTDDKRVIEHCRDASVNIENGVLYSTITVGYEKKDYDSINGRDEFNFNNTYTTGCTVSDKTLSLLSKYRADSYGLEFVVQKRGADTTDNQADKDVFFLLCVQSGKALVPDRSLEVGNVRTDGVFNGAFSPISCLRSNAGFIGLMAAEIFLTFASSTANSDVTIGDEKMSDNLLLNTPLATCAVLEFSTDLSLDFNPDSLIEVSSNGLVYRGFLKDVSLKYARSEAAKYKLIVKEIEI